MKTRAALLLALAVASAAPTAAQDWGCAAGTPLALQEIAAAGAFTIGYRRNADPISFSPDGPREADGYAVDLCERIFHAVRGEIEERCGVEIGRNYRGVDSDDRFRRLLAGEIDILCGTTSKTLARERELDFTLPIFVTGGVFASRDRDRVRDFADLAGKRLAILPGTTTETTVRQKLRDLGVVLAPAGEPVHVSSIADGLRRLGLPPGDTQAVDAFAADQLPLLAQLERRGRRDVYVSSRFFSLEIYALALRKDRRPVRVIADRVLARLYRTRKIDDLYRTWFGGLGNRGEGIPPGLDMLFRLNAIPEGAPIEIRDPAP